MFAQIVNLNPLGVTFLECKAVVNLCTLVESVIHENHHPRMGTTHPSTSVNPCLNPRCSDIPFPHEPESDHVLMMHEIITLEGEDPRLAEMFSIMRPTKPTFGSGYLEQAKGLIPACRFCPLPYDCKKPTIMEMHKFFTLMSHCLKSEISSTWMKAMLNWDLFTNPDVEQFGLSHSIEEKKRLAEDWKHYM